MPSAEWKARRAARVALDKKAGDLVVLDVQRVSSVTDYFLICSGQSRTHVQTITDAIRGELKGEGVQPRHAEGMFFSRTPAPTTRSSGCGATRRACRSTACDVRARATCEGVARSLVAC
jgi:ribosome silencing factor RsfS/YbeB/iojap